MTLNHIGSINLCAKFRFRSELLHWGQFISITKRSFEFELVEEKIDDLKTENIKILKGNRLILQ